MSIKDDDVSFEKLREMQDIGSAKVTIHRDQVLEIVVADLIAKYKACKDRNDEYTESFKQVLSFYLDAEEMNEIEAI